MAPKSMPDTDATDGVGEVGRSTATGCSSRATQAAARAAAAAAEAAEAEAEAEAHAAALAEAGVARSEAAGASDSTRSLRSFTTGSAEHRRGAQGMRTMARCALDNLECERQLLLSLQTEPKVVGESPGFIMKIRPTAVCNSYCNRL